MRLNKFLSLAGVASRRKSDDLISAGKVFLNGKRVTEMGVQVDPKKDEVKYNGKKVVVNSEKKYVAMNKPVGFTCTKEDRHAEKKVYELLSKEMQNLKYAGRLDRDTAGLLIFSDDGEFIQALTHPSKKIEKEYEVVSNKELRENEKKLLERGVVIEGKKTVPAKVIEVGEKIFRIIIQEGRNRQVRKMCSKVGHKVLELKRVRIGEVNLGDLEKGKTRLLTKQEINSILQNA